MKRQPNMQCMTGEVSAGCLAVEIGVVVLLICLYGLGVFGKASDKCGAAISGLNIATRVITTSVIPPNEDTQEKYFNRLEQAHWCAASYNDSEQDRVKYMVKENWFGEEYSLMVYTKWKWVAKLSQAIKEVLGELI